MVQTTRSVAPKVFAFRPGTRLRVRCLLPDCQTINNVLTKFGSCRHIRERTPLITWSDPFLVDLLMYYGPHIVACCVEISTVWRLKHMRDNAWILIGQQINYSRAQWHWRIMLLKHLKLSDICEYQDIRQKVLAFNWEPELERPASFHVSCSWEREMICYGNIRKTW